MKIEKSFLGVSVSRQIKSRLSDAASRQKEAGNKATQSSVAEAALELGLAKLEKLSPDEIMRLFATKGDNHLPSSKALAETP